VFLKIFLYKKFFSFFFFIKNAQPQSVVWGRTDGSSLPANVIQEGNDLVFRNPSAEQAGNYICTITHPDGTTERINVYLDYRPGKLSLSEKNFYFNSILYY